MLNFIEYEVPSLAPREAEEEDRRPTGCPSPALPQQNRGRSAAGRRRCLRTRCRQCAGRMGRSIGRPMGRSSGSMSVGSEHKLLDSWAGEFGAGTELGELDVFGKGGKGNKGKGGDGERFLDCWKWSERWHPSRLCPSAVGAGQNKTGPQCNLCKGYGHMKGLCISKGG